MNYIPVGTLIGGRYRVEKYLGHGNANGVFAAQDTHLFRRTVAVKILQYEQYGHNFRRELRAHASIRHACVMAVYDWGQHDGQLYAVYECFAPGSISLLDCRGGLAPARVAGLATNLSSALAAVHRVGLIHRELNPRSIQLVHPGTPRETPVICDFGKSCMAGDDVESYYDARYNAPEERGFHNAAIPADIYGLAATMHFALTGHPPLLEDGGVLMSPRAPWSRRLSAEVRAVLLKALALDPLDRYEDAHVFGSALAAALMKVDSTMSPLAQPLRVFLCHASADKPKVRELYRLLLAHNIDAWFDEAKLLPGQEWQQTIAAAVKTSDAVIVCLSAASVRREGFVQKELRWALDVADEKPDGEIFIVPARLEECDVPTKLRSRQWVDLYADTGVDALLCALRWRADSLAAKR